VALPLFGYHFPFCSHFEAPDSLAIAEVLESLPSWRCQDRVVRLSRWTMRLLRISGARSKIVMVFD
jgi:hypothetical protein